MNATPTWALTLSYFLHLTATVVWIGSLAVLNLLLFPVARRSLDEAAFARLLDGLQRKLDPLGWFSLLVLIGSGLLQMSANPNYEGFLAITNTWARAILLKHLLIGGMVLISAALTWGVLPALQRAALLRVRGKGNSQEESRLRRRERLLLRINFWLSLLVLALTAIARAA